MFDAIETLDYLQANADNAYLAQLGRLLDNVPVLDAVEALREIISRSATYENARLFEPAPNVMPGQLGFGE